MQVPLSRQQPVAFELRRADACVSAVLGAAGPGAGGLQPRDAANAAGSASDATPEGGLVPSGFQLWRASDAAAPAANPIPGVWREVRRSPWHSCFETGVGSMFTVPKCTKDDSAGEVQHMLPLFLMD